MVEVEAIIVDAAEDEKVVEIGAVVVTLFMAATLKYHFFPVAGSGSKLLGEPNSQESKWGSKSKAVHQDCFRQIALH